MAPTLIALEEHFFSARVLDSLDDKYAEQLKAIPGVKEKLEDLGQLRLNDMDKNKITFQVISHAPISGAPSLEQCVAANNQLKSAVKENPTRFAGFAILPMAQPLEAAAELQRAVKELGFVGALIDCHVHGRYYDGDEYLPFWQAAQELDVPVYIHPTWPSDNMMPQVTGNFSAGATRSLGASGWGWHSDTGLHVLRLYASKLFDRLPRLKIIIGHFGEMIPFQLERIYVLSRRWGDMERNFQKVWEENIWLTTSGVWSLAPLATIIRNTPIEHVLFSVDYPFEKNENGLKWIEELEQSGMVTKEQLELIAHKNAANLLKIDESLYKS